MTTPSEDTSLAEALAAAEGRQARLAGRLKGLRTRAADGSLDRWLLLTGGLLVPAGILAVILGWIGASRTPLVFEQIPYLISGGLLGVALVFAGGFIYFAYWQSVRVRDARMQQRELIQALRRIEGRLVLLEGNPVAANGSHAGSSNGRGRSLLVATETGSMVHTRDCPVVQGRDKLRSVPADGGGMVPCKICDPLNQTVSLS